MSAGGVADHMVTQLLRQSDAEVFELYSQAKLGMMREALAKLDRVIAATILDHEPEAAISHSYGLFSDCTTLFGLPDLCDPAVSASGRNRIAGGSACDAIPGNRGLVG